MQYRIFRKDYKVAEEDLSEGFKFYRPEIVLPTQKEAIRIIEEKLNLIKTLEGKLDPDKYYSIYMRFTNFLYVAKIFHELAKTYIAMSKYFEDNDHHNQSHQ